MALKQDNTADRDGRFAAYGFGAFVIVGFVLYWGAQIQSVREMLALAYG